MFRHRNIKAVPAVPRPIMDEVEVETVDANGVRLVSFHQVSNDKVASSLPAYSDYQLSALLAANVPLQPVKAQVVNAVPTDSQIEAAITELEKMDNNDDSDNSDNSGNSDNSDLDLDYFQNFSND